MATTATSTQASDNSGKRTKMLLVGVVVAAALGVGGFFAGNMLSNRQPAAPVAPVTPAPIFVTMDAFTVNLRTEDGDRFLHTGLSLKVRDVPTQTRLTEYMPEARSRVLLLLSARQPAELATVEGKHKLAEDIKARLNEPFATTLPAQQINDVLFTSFVVQ